MLLLVGGLILLSIAVAMGFAASRLVKSPAQVLAEQSAPAATRLMQPVERRQVKQSVAFDATVERQFETDIPAPLASDGSTTAVVTSLKVSTGTQVRPGRQLAEMNGEPIFALQGRLPSYRALQPGMSGPDVAQLQSALGSIGFRIYDDRGVYGDSTSLAIESLFASHGYRATIVGIDDRNAAQQAVTALERALAQDKAAKASKLQLSFDVADLAAAKQKLSDAAELSGAQLGLGQIVFVPSLPATVTSIGVTLGASATGPLMRLASGPLVARGAPSAVDASMIRLGNHADLLLGSGGQVKGQVASSKAEGAGSSAGDASTDGGASGADTASTVFTVTVGRKLKGSSVGTAVRVEVVVATSRAAALTVPVSAVQTSSSGGTYVTLGRGKGSKDVSVTPGFSGDGFVQIVPKRDDAINVDDQVFVGIAAAGG